MKGGVGDGRQFTGKGDHAVAENFGRIGPHRIETYLVAAYWLRSANAQG